MKEGKKREQQKLTIKYSNECKRRKIKCNGQTPCQRCGNLNLSCQYAPNCCASSFKESEEFKAITSHLTSLQQQVESLYASMDALRRDHDTQNRNGYGASSMMSQSPMDYRGTSSAVVKATPKFQGPTSSAYSFDVAKHTLQNMGYTPLESGLGDGPDGGGDGENETPIGSPRLTNEAIPGWIETRNIRGDVNGDPLEVLSREEALRLCQVYADEIGSMYPVLDMDTVAETCQFVHDRLDEQLRQNPTANDQKREYNIADHDLNNLKMVIAIATVVEGSGLSSLGERLYHNILPILTAIINRESVNIHDIPLIVCVATYHFHCDREALAWRAVGHAARMCIELGLHRSSSLLRHFPDDEERGHATRIFWCVYCLDRRWSFGTGMPFAMQDTDIDPTLPTPSDSLEYLTCMIEYSRLGGRVWRSVAGWEDGGELRREDVGYLDYKITEWQKSIPRALQLQGTGQVSGLTAQPTSRAMHRLQIILLLRTNQMRILIYRPVLHSASSIAQNPGYAETVVDLARDTIRVLTHLNQTTDIYRAQQVCFNYFLISALAVLFLASCHAPVQFSKRCKEEFYMALELVKSFSSRSYVSKRLWRTIKGLKEVGPKLGLELDTERERREGEGEDPHSSAALAMAGLAGQPIPAHTMGGFGAGGQGAVVDGESPEVNGFHMSNEMTHLFEAALGAGTGLQGGYTPGADGEMGGAAQMLVGMPNGGAGGSGIFGGDEELYRQMRDLF